MEPDPLRGCLEVQQPEQRRDQPRQLASRRSPAWSRSDAALLSCVAVAGLALGCCLYALVAPGQPASLSPDRAAAFAAPAVALPRTRAYHAGPPRPPTGLPALKAAVAATDAEPAEVARGLKYKLLQLSASFDRGFGASTWSKEQVDGLVQQLEAINPTPFNTSRGIEGEALPDGPAPLAGAWQMVWTTAPWVLNLAASPVTQQGAIYEVFDPPVVTNIIDLIPRAQALLPTSAPSTLVRAEVTTRASRRPETTNRIELSFESVKLTPVEVFGAKADFLPPLSFNLPQVKGKDFLWVDPEQDASYFEVVYLDGDMLIIRPNSPGAYFVSLKVDNYDP